MTEVNTDEAIRAVLLDNGHQPAGRRPARNQLPDLAEPMSSENTPRFSGAVQRSGVISVFLKNNRLRRRHLVLIGAALLIAFYPWHVLWGVLLVLAVFNIVYFSLGPDICTEKTVAAYKWLAQRRPHTAEKIRLAARRTSLRLGEAVEKLPAHWTTGLYLPDFDEPQEVELLDELPDPFDRLMNVSENA